MDDDRKDFRKQVSDYIGKNELSTGIIEIMCREKEQSMYIIRNNNSQRVVNCGHCNGSVSNLTEKDAGGKRKKTERVGGLT